MEEREHMLAAIAAQEQLRGSLPDAVVDVAIAALRSQLGATDAGTATIERRGQASVLFADIAGFTALSDRMDAELLAQLMNELWRVVDEAIERHGGHIDKHIGDAVMGVWGSTGAREDDPERTVRAALDLRDAVARFIADHSLDLAVRIGVNTGPVLFGAVGTGGERSVTGDAVNVASRVEGLAPHGAVLVAHDTYRRVQGVFDVQPLAPATVKGKMEPVRTYLVERVKTRTFHLRARGVEGVETPMIGRDREMRALQSSFLEAIAERSTRVVTIVGEPGAGKSRLLDELAMWLDLRPESVLYLKGRSTPDLEIVRLGLLRELFSYRFEILDDDTPGIVAGKLRDGLAPLEPREAELVGLWLGFDLGSSEAARDLAGSPEFGTIAESLLARYLRSALEESPAVVLLEDVHWADGDSLEAITHLVEQLPAAPLLIVAVARPTLDQRRPDWRAGPGAAQRIDLHPLEGADARELVGEILRLVDHVPAALVDLVVANADGNPFYVEELVKMLIEQGVVRIADDGPWTVNLSRLQGVSVPPTLAGVLQARLDALPADERTAVQHASVIGRTFWDDAVAALLAASGAAQDADIDGTGTTLTRVRRRELVWRHDRSSISGCVEYRFKHALLRDAAYETVLLRHRGVLHAAAAAWMERRAGARIDEHLAPLAEHLALAGDLHRAAQLLERAADHAAATGGISAACTLYRRCLEWLAETGDDHGLAATRVRVERASLLELKGGDHQQMVEDLATAEHDATALDNQHLLAMTRSHQARRALRAGDLPAAKERLQSALPLAEAEGGRVLAEFMLMRAWYLDATNDPQAALEPGRRALALGHDIGHAETQIRARNQLALSLSRTGGYDEAADHLDAAIVIAQRTGNPIREAMLLSTRGALEHIRATTDRTGELLAAIEHYSLALEICREHGYDAGLHDVLANLAQAEVESGRIDDGNGHTLECLRAEWDRGNVPNAAFAVIVLAQVVIAKGDLETGVAMIGTAVGDPRSEGHVDELQRILGTLDIQPEDAEPMLRAGAERPLEDLVAELLEPTSPGCAR